MPSFQYGPRDRLLAGRQRRFQHDIKPPLLRVAMIGDGRVQNRVPREHEYIGDAAGLFDPFASAFGPVASARPYIEYGDGRPSVAAWPVDLGLAHSRLLDLHPDASRALDVPARPVGAD